MRRRRVAAVVTVALTAAAPALAQQAGARLWPIGGAVVSTDDEGADELLGMSDRELCLDAGAYVLGVFDLGRDVPVAGGLNPSGRPEEHVASAAPGASGWSWSLFRLMRSDEPGYPAGCYELWVFGGEARLWWLDVDLEDVLASVREGGGR